MISTTIIMRFLEKNNGFFTFDRLKHIKENSNITEITSRMKPIKYMHLEQLFCGIEFPGKERDFLG